MSNECREDVQRAMSATLDPYAVLRQLMRAMARRLAPEILGAYVLERDGEWLAPVQGYHLPPDRVDVLRRLKLSIKKHAFYAEGFASQRSMFSANVDDEPGICPAIRTTVPHRAQLFVPIVRDDRMLGGIVAAWMTTTPPEFDAGERELMEWIGSQAGVVLENAHLFRAYLERRDLAHAVRMELRWSVILSALETPIGSGFGVDTIELYWRTSSSTDVQILVRIVDGVSDRRGPDLVATSTTGLAAVVLRSGRALRTANVSEACLAWNVNAPAGSEAYKHWLGVPMLAAGHAVGVLAVGHRHFAFTAAHERSLTRAAYVVALALCDAALERTPADLVAHIAARVRETREDVGNAEFESSRHLMEASVARADIAPAPDGI